MISLSFLLLPKISAAAALSLFTLSGFGVLVSAAESAWENSWEIGNEYLMAKPRQRREGNGEIFDTSISRTRTRHVPWSAPKWAVWRAMQRGTILKWRQKIYQIFVVSNDLQTQGAETVSCLYHIANTNINLKIPSLGTIVFSLKIFSWNFPQNKTLKL